MTNISPKKPESKICSRCGEDKPLDEFYKDRRRRDGLYSHCKDCHLETCRKHYYETLEEQHERSRKYREENPRSTSYYREYYADNAEEINKKHKRWRQSNKEKAAGYYRRYKKRNAQRVAVNNRNRQARLMGAEGAYTFDEFQALVAHYGNKCLCCGKKKLTADHVLPLSKGGTNHISNIQPLCRSCNSSKGANYIDYRSDAGEFARKLANKKGD